MTTMPTVTAIISDEDYCPELHDASSAPRRGSCSWHGKPHEITRSMRLEEHRESGRREALYGVCEAARAEIIAEVEKNTYRR